MNALVPIDKAKRLVDDFSSDIRLALPSNIPYERFRAAFITAVANSPDILQCEPQSIRTALMKAAADNLMPDGREAAIVRYNTKVQREGRDVWLNLAQYMPMVQGIRKRALELGHVRIAAEVVYKNDFFDEEKGDNPFIKHKPVPLGMPSGEIAGAYAIFRDSDNVIVHRETISLEDINAARSVSKSANGPAWGKFFSEMARKVVLRRGAKSVPTLPDDLRRVIERDDDMVDFSLPHPERSFNPLVEHSAAESFMVDADGVISEPVSIEVQVTHPPVVVTSGPLEEPPQAQEEPQAATDAVRRDTDRELLEGFSKALGDATDVAVMKAKSNEYWQTRGGKPDVSQDLGAKAKSIFAIHLDALSGKLTSEECEALIRQQLG